jgi:hypothetical protein
MPGFIGSSIPFSWTGSHLAQQRLWAFICGCAGALAEGPLPFCCFAATVLLCLLSSSTHKCRRHPRLVPCFRQFSPATLQLSARRSQDIAYFLIPLMFSLAELFFSVTLQVLATPPAFDFSQLSQLSLLLATCLNAMPLAANFFTHASCPIHSLPPPL